MKYQANPVVWFYPGLRCLCLVLSLLLTDACLAQDLYYAKGAVIDSAAFVTDKDGSQVSLSALLAEHPGQLTVLYIFGGGDMGAGLPGHLWCQDSFEDTHILRTLVAKYQDKNVNFIAVASAPVYHSQMLGFPGRALLDDSADSENFRLAETAFVSSTQAAYEDGILPVQPYFDLRLRLMLNRSENLQPGSGFGQLQDWQGAFRAPGETQFYGVPSFWLLSSEGEILAEPLRGNIYHPHGTDVNIAYTFADVDTRVQELLQP